jgi:hypothetical protein
MYYIYAYLDPRTNLPFYIGKGKKSRKLAHLKETASNTDNHRKYAVLQELKELNLEPSIVELESDINNELIAYNREDYYILLYGRKGIDEGGILTNIILSGQPPTPIWTDAKKKAHSNFNKSYWTPERRKAHGLKTKGNTGGVAGGLAVKNTVSVIDLAGNTMRISKEEYENLDRTKPINTWMYVSVSSKEGKRRMNLKDTTLGPVTR